MTTARQPMPAEKFEQIDADTAAMMLAKIQGDDAAVRQLVRQLVDSADPVDELTAALMSLIGHTYVAVSIEARAAELRGDTSSPAIQHFTRAATARNRPDPGPSTP